MTKMKFKDDLNTLVSDMITDAKAALQIEDATFQESEVAYNDALEAAKKPAKEDESKVIFPILLHA